VKRRFSFPIFFLIFLSLFSTVSIAQAILPDFQSYDIGNATPFVDESVDITLYLNFILDEEGDISSLVGTLTVQLFWSRDQTSYHGVTMELMASNNMYRGTIPAQDGSDNQFYNEGSGPCYWYIKISNSGGEKLLFTSNNPNSEIYFLDSGAGTTVIIGEEIDTYIPPNPIAEVFDDVFSSSLGTNIARDPVFQTIVLVIVGLVVAAIAFSIRSERLVSGFLKYLR